MQHLLHHQYLLEDLWRLHPNVTCVISFFGAHTLSPTRVAIKKGRRLIYHPSVTNAGN